MHNHYFTEILHTLRKNRVSDSKKFISRCFKKTERNPQPRFTPSVSSADSFLKEEALLGAYPPKIKRNSAASHALTAEFSFNMQPVFR